MHKIVYLDAYTANHGDLEWTDLQSLGDVEIYDHSTLDQIISRGKDADILIVNKARIDANNIHQFHSLKLIVVSATGYNNIDVAAVKKAGILVCNVRDYSTTSVAQHVFSSIFALYNRTEYYNYKVRKGVWSETRDFCFYDHSIEEIAGKTLGVIGYGNIGKKVAQIGVAFGMNVLVGTRSGEEKHLADDIESTTISKIFEKSDIVSLHAPLNPQTNLMINKTTLNLMKNNAVLINTSRGGLINEMDLTKHLSSHPEFYALLDVLSIEPPTDLNALVEQPNCLITPHIAWASKQARIKLISACVENIKSFQDGTPINLVGL